jgi:hypothetical protein
MSGRSEANIAVPSDSVTAMIRKNYRRPEKLLNFSPYYCGAKFFN